MNICVFGAASNLIDKSYIEACESFVAKMAKRGHCLVFGGGTGGLMGACARAAKANNTKIFGVSPKFFDHDGILYDNCDELIFTDTLRERKRIMEDMADGFVIMPGGVGTMEEFFEVFSANQLNTMQKPIALYNINGYFDKLLGFIHHMVSEGFLSEECLSIAQIFNDEDKLLSFLENSGK